MTDTSSLCCPLLTPLAVCKEGIVHYYEGDMWNVSNCKFCICHNGQKSCSFAQCAKIKCGEVNIDVNVKYLCCSSQHLWEIIFLSLRSCYQYILIMIQFIRKSIHGYMICTKQIVSAISDIKT